MHDGVHEMLTRDEMCPGAKKYWDFYNMVPGAGFYQKEFGYYSLEKWKREEGLAEDADLKELFGFDPQGRADVGGLGWCEAGFMPVFEEKVLEDRGDYELVQDFEYRIQQQGLKLQDYLKYMGMNMDAFRTQFTEQAEKQVKTRLAMEAVVVKEKIEATEEEFEAEVKRIADAYQMEADKVKSIVDAAAVKADLAVNKAIDFVKNAAKISVETEDKSDENKD